MNHKRKLVVALSALAASWFAAPASGMPSLIPVRAAVWKAVHAAPGARWLMLAGLAVGLTLLAFR